MLDSISASTKSNQTAGCCALITTQGNDVELQFHENDTADKSEDCLVEMRLYLPEDVNDDESGNDDQPAPMYTSETFQQAVMDQANIRYY
jgi:Structure-specific recognition protein (SSRP1)